MAVEIKFSKSNTTTPWGFRLVGGAEFDQPLIVVKVNDDSIAEQAGLEEGDIVVRINDASTAGMTHTQAHDLLTSTGLEFVLGVRKGEINMNNIINVDDDYQGEFADLLKGISESVEKDILMEAAQIISKGENELKTDKFNERSQQHITYVDEKQSKNIYNEILTHGIKKDKQWSTFLIKPDKPIPTSKKTVDVIEAQDEGYKVDIRKQPRKQFLKKVQFDQNVVEVEQQNDIANNENSSTEETVSTVVNIDLDDMEKEENSETPDIIEDYVDVEIPNNSEEMEDDRESQMTKDSLEEIKYKPISEIRVDDETCMTLEEQLKAVQKQLQMLSQLPSAIQLTLDAVSKQLATIVSTKENSEERDEARNAEELDERHNEELEVIEEEGSVSEKAEAEVYHGNMEDTSSSVGEEFEDDILTEEIRAIMERSEQEADGGGDSEVVSSPGMTEEELEAKLKEEEAKRQEEERLAKKQKVATWNDSWPWSDKTKPVYRESNCWKVPSRIAATKNINFLKYQPPPKNLDYLQRSDVYRLVHNMEPQVKGIVSRPEKIPAVQDYYEAIKYSP